MLDITDVFTRVYMLSVKAIDRIPLYFVLVYM